MEFSLDFEKPLLALEGQIRELKSANEQAGVDLSQEISQLEKKVGHLMAEIYQNLSPWQRVQIARHPGRPHGIDYIENLFTDFHELSGDRLFGDDQSIIGGLGFLGTQKVAVVAIEKGRKTNDKVKRNFGMPHPEGYRKAGRIMELASRFQIPILTFIDTPGAYPGISSEERGQASAIANNLELMFDLEVPVLSVIIGEGGSGGALGLAIGNIIGMQEHSVYSVISPESCASILWSDPTKAEQAANSLQMTSEKTLELGVVDSVISEPLGGAHRDWPVSFSRMNQWLARELAQLKGVDGQKLREQRIEKFRRLGNEHIKAISVK